MDLEKDVIQIIDEKFPKMSKSHKAIARFIKEEYDQAVFMTAAKIGEKLSISESTVVRFASGLGYDGYPEFQRKLAEWVKNKLNVVQKVNSKYGKSSQTELLHSVLTSDMEKISDTLQSMDPIAFEAAVNVILEAKTIYIVGIRSCEPLAEFLSFYLNMIRGDVVLLKTTSVSEMFENILRISENDVIIGISFPRYSKRTVNALNYAKNQGAKVISITDSDTSPLAPYSDCLLLARSEMASFVDSLVAPLSLINALIVAIGLSKQDEVSALFVKLENIWDEYNVYEKADDLTEQN